MLQTGLFLPSKNYSQPHSGHVLILAPGELPTTHYYLHSRLCKPNQFHVSHYNSLSTCPRPKMPKGTFVVIVRHANPDWLRYLVAYSSQWSGVAFLMDDDIPSAWHCREVPLDYGLWTSGRYFWISSLLSQVCDRIWVSTPVLQKRYSQTTLVSPWDANVASRSPTSQGCRRWGYHGTRIHQRELAWLLPIVRQVQCIMPNAEFEVFGNKRIASMFKNIPRVHVLSPCSWPEYVAYCRHSNLAVGLAPMLPGRFNDARSHTKIFDITRCGAVGIFSDCPAYSSNLKDSGALIHPNDQHTWIEAILRLLEDDALRFQHYDHVTHWLHSAAKAVIMPSPFDIEPNDAL